MEYLTLEVIDDAIAHIKINRPEALNALSTKLMNELLSQLKSCDRDQQIKVILLSGTGKAFAAGADVKEMSELQPADYLRDNLFQAWDELTTIKKPLVACLHGFALGGGLELAMACDIITAAKSTRLGQPEIKLATIPGAGGTQRLTQAVGKYQAMLKILTGDLFTAEEAYDLGLLSALFEDEEVLEKTLEIARKIAVNSSLATQLAKDAINHADLPLEQGLHYERRNFYLTFSTEDQKEGMAAFLQKRAPTFQGR